LWARRRGRRATCGVAVIGLGRFGAQVAESLARLGQEVLAIDADNERVRKWSQQLTQVVQADTTDQRALRQLGVPDLERVIVAIGTPIESSVLTVLALTELGVPEIWARATSTAHAKILSSVGAHHVIFPEAEMGERVAHLIISKLLDFVEFGTDFAIAKTRAPGSLVGRRLGDVGMRERYGVMVVGVRRADNRFDYAGPDTVITPDSMLIVEGTIDQVQRFAGTD
jgi:trk system potassium uptake protein TrkA